MPVSPIITSSPLVKQNGAALSDSLMTALIEVVVDLDATRPSMFVLRFAPTITPGQSSGVTFAVGDTVDILEATTSKPLLSGEVTSLEAEFGPAGQRIVVRGYDKSHRLHRARKYRKFPDQKDSDIVSALAGEASIPTGTVTATADVHKYIAQVNQTDWEFLKWRAEENGLTLDTADGKLNFRKPDPPGPAAFTLSVQETLLAFRPRLSAPAVSSVQAQSWDESQKAPFTHTEQLSAGTAATLGASPSSLAGKFGSQTHLSTIRSAEAVGGPTAVAKALSDRFADSFIDADGVAIGDPGLLPGVLIEVKDTGATFDGTYRITAAKHVFDAEHRYVVNMRFSGIQNKSLLSLTSNGSAAESRLPRMNGVVPAIVTNVKDPESRCRVKIKFPWLGDDVETEWARTVQVGAGPTHGAVILPEVNDEVLVAFEQGDFRRPYVLGGVYNGKDKPHTSVAYTVGGSGVERRGFASRLGHRIFIDESDSASGVKLETSDGNFVLYLNQKDTKITIDAKSGKVEIHGAQDVSVKSDANVNIEATGTLSLKGTGGVTIESSATASFKASASMSIEGATTAVKGSGTLSLESSGMAQLKGSMVKIN